MIMPPLFTLLPYPYYLRLPLLHHLSTRTREFVSVARLQYNSTQFSILKGYISVPCPPFSLQVQSQSVSSPPHNLTRAPHNLFELGPIITLSRLEACSLITRSTPTLLCCFVEASRDLNLIAFPVLAAQRSPPLLHHVYLRLRNLLSRTRRHRPEFQDAPRSCAKDRRRRAPSLPPGFPQSFIA